MHKPSLVILIAASCMPAWAEDNPEPLRITVTASRTETLVKEAPGSVSIISRQELEQKGSENVLEALRDTPGVSLQGIGTGGRKIISLRGMESRHTLLLIDGKRIPASNDSIGPNTDYQYDWVPVEQIERIEVVRGPMSVLYGSDALGGVVNIITRKPGRQTTGSASLAGRVADGDQGGDGHALTFNLNGGVNDKLQLGLTGQQSRRSAVDSRLVPGTSAIEGKEKQQLSLRADWQPKDGHNLQLEHTSGQEERWYDTLTRANTAYQSRYDIDRQQTSLEWQGRIAGAKSSLRAYQSEVDVVNSADNGVPATDPQNLREQVMEANTAFAVGERHYLTLGLEQRKEELTHPKLPAGSDSATTQAAFAQDEIELGERTLLTLGVRLDDHETFGGETSPRLAISHEASDKLTLKASYGHGFRSPTIKQTAPGYSFPAGIFIINSNPDLQPETNDALELGAHYADRDLTLDAALFNNEVDNLIDTRFDSLLPGGVQEWVYDNIDSATLRGGEISARYQLREGLQLHGNYQYLDATDSDGQRLERRPRHTLSAGVEWEKNGWQTSLRAEHLADQTIIPPGSRDMSELPDYTLWNIGANKPLGKHLQLGAGIDNLTNVRLEDKSPDFRHEEYPRTLRLELKGSF